MLLLLNIFAPTTSDVRVVKYVVPIVSQVRGRVIEVPVENNRPVKKGDVLFKIDPTPYENEVRSLEAQAGVGRGEGRGRSGPADRDAGPAARRAVGRAAADRTTEPGDEPGRPRCRRRSTWPRSASRRTPSSPPPAPATASISSRRRPTSTSSTAQIAAARAAEQQVREKLSGRVKGDLAPVARRQGADRRRRTRRCGSRRRRPRRRAPNSRTPAGI